MKQASCFQTGGSWAAQGVLSPALVATIFAVGIVFAIEWDFTAPIASELRDLAIDGVVMQSSGASCAAASAANLARHYGLIRTEPEMAALLGTTRFGTSPGQVVQGLGRLGISCQKRVHTDVDPTSVHLPAVLFFPPATVAGVGHAVLLTGVEGQRVVVLDPLSGEQAWSRAELAARWKGHAVECERAPQGQRAP